MHGVVDGVHAEVICTAVCQTALESAAGQPEGEAAMMMAATDLHFTIGFLKRCPAEFRGPDDQRFIEHPARLEVGDERREALIGAGGVGAVIANEAAAVAMRIPFAAGGTIQDLNEPHTVFHEAARGEAGEADHGADAEDGDGEAEVARRHREARHTIAELQLIPLGDVGVFGEEVVKLLIGNKDDQPDRKCVDPSVAREFAKDHEMLFMETSAMRAINVTAAFKLLVAEAMHQADTVASQPSAFEHKLKVNAERQRRAIASSCPCN